MNFAATIATVSLNYLFAPVKSRAVRNAARLNSNDSSVPRQDMWPGKRQLCRSQEAVRPFRMDRVALAAADFRKNRVETSGVVYPPRIIS